MSRTSSTAELLGGGVNSPSSFEVINLSHNDVRSPQYRTRNTPSYTRDSKLARRCHLKHYFGRITAKLELPAFLLSGSVITAGFASTCFVPLLIAIGNVSSNPQVWMNQTRIEDYEPCYEGCNDCSDPELSYKACLRTAAIESGDPNITCDGTKIWFWLDRYPPACLRVRGEHYRNIALKKMEQDIKLRSIILAITFGLIGAKIAYQVWKYRMKRRAEAREGHWPGWRLRERTTHRCRSVKRVTIGLLTMLSGRASARMCIKHGGIANELLKNGNESIWVHVHSAFGECYDRRECHRYWDCGDSSCEGSPSLKCDPCTDASCRPPSAELCFNHTHVPRAAQEFVNEILPEMMHCGFRLQEDFEPFPRVRLANPGFEMNWFVRVEVSGFNVTNPWELDEEIICLHSIGDRKPPTNRTDWLTSPYLLPRPSSIGVVSSFGC
ncbi:hypothetical protein ANO14919_037680 [Xylariales sp. No.14919]|nr:hypothetical protein ANO14919_037680 [Xylariales sp. No.14919]